LPLRRLDRDHLLRDELDDHAPAVGRVGDAPDVASLLEAVDDARHRAGRQAHQLRQATGRRGAAIEQHRQRLDVRFGQAEPDRHGLPEERALEVHPPQRADDGIDLVAVHG